MTKNKKDLTLGIILYFILLGITLYFNAFDVIVKTMAEHEEYQLDEFVLALVLLSVFGLWYSYRRYFEVNCIQNKLKHLNESLEKQVEEKTKELETLNQNLEIKIKEEVEKNIQKELLIFEQSKMASMGAMIGHIAHQWRQPLSMISTAASGIKLKQECDILNKEELTHTMNKVVQNVEYLSNTIDTFRNFLKEDKEYKIVVIQERIDIALKITDMVLKDHLIKLHTNIDYENPIQTKLVVGELEEVIINIINNAKDILIEKKIRDPWIKLELKTDENNILLTIEDNAGGISDDILPHIFDEYFTTKNDEKGTGLGLYMSHQIIHKSLKGELSVHNTQNGAKFIIRLPIS